MRVLVVNIYFDPQSFGGATVVAERMAEQLSVNHGWEVCSLAVRFADLPTASIVRYRTRFGSDGFNIGLPYHGDKDYEARFRNRDFIDPFARVLDHVRPDVVHVHCIQDIGAEFLDVLVERQLPFAVTIHDFWWICERQFMIDIQGNYCGQRKIDYARCAVCSGQRARVERRAEYLKAQLAKADRILAVSDFTRDMLVANGLPEAKVVVNKNGIAPPGDDYVPDRRGAGGDGEPTVFGFVGGPGPIKGWDLIVEAFSALPRESYRLLAVDGGAAIGQSWRRDLERSGGHLNLEVIPAYTSQTINDTFRRFDALLAPSNWKETFGLTVREALVRQIWVIASDAGGLAEDIADGINGRVLSFPPTAEELYRAVSEKIKNKSGNNKVSPELVLIEAQAEQLSRTLHTLVQEPAEYGSEEKREDTCR
ncbi:MAG: glycosyltransferase family 4 protein [Rhizobiaceae bacterium]